MNDKVLQMTNIPAHYPCISVIMGVYNCADTLPEALDCLTRQTEENWELVACDDASTDDSYAVLRAYQDRFPEKVRLLRNERNRGLNYTLNRCLEAAHGEYIARMDGDDVCDPERFAKELSALREDPAIAIVSTDMEYFDDTGVWGRVSHPSYPEMKDFLHGSPFCHAPCMVKRTALDAVGGYTEEARLLRVEDYHLWIKMYKAGFRGKNIHEPLYRMRDDRAAYERRTFRSRLNEAFVKSLAVRELQLPVYGYLYSLRPLILGLLPRPVYDCLHRWNLRRRQSKTK